LDSRKELDLRNSIQITSLQNPQIKKIVQLRDRKGRKQSGQFVVEGAREQEKAISQGLKVCEIYTCSSLLSEHGENILNSLRDLDCTRYSLNEPCFEKITVRKSTDGILLVLHTRENLLKDFMVKKNSFLLLVEGVEKPGNLGALLRTADGAGVDGVLVIDSQIDLYNPNVIRSSLGTCFSLPIAFCSREEAYLSCKKNQIAIYASVLSNASVYYHTVEYAPGSALLLGSEDKGIDPFWIAHADCCVTIPMHGRVDSLNVSAAGAILLYEVAKKRF
jgi:TrmH family RNA methyltransferase